MLSVHSSVPTVSVVIPTLNEARNLPFVFGLLPDVFEVIVVDGRSSDDTVAVARSLRPDIRVISQTRKGKGNALACGFAAARGDIIVMLDADGSADPREIPRFVRALVEGADFAKGSRSPSAAASADITRMRRLGNRALNGLVNLAYRTVTAICATDTTPSGPTASPPRPERRTTGRRDALGRRIRSRNPHQRPRRTSRPTGSRSTSFEADRIHGASNLNAISDGLRVLRTIAVERRTPNQHGR